MGDHEMAAYGANGAGDGNGVGYVDGDSDAEDGGATDPLEWEIEAEAGADDADPDGEGAGTERGYWDLCLVMAGVQKPANPKAEEGYRKRMADRGRVLMLLKAAGLMLSKRVSSDGKFHYYLVSARQSRLELQAEVMELELKLQPRFGGGFAPFTRENKHIFLHAFDDDFFTRTQRQHIVRAIIENDQYNGGADVSLTAHMRNGTFNKVFLLHHKLTRRYLGSVWAHWKFWQWWKPQPLHVLQDYFGEELTLYFAWLEYYNSALFFPMVFGCIVMGLQFVDGSNGWPNVIYTFYMQLWTTFFLEFWKRKQNKLAFEWNMLEFEATEASRPDYQGQEQLGVHSIGQWVAFDPKDPVLETVHVVPTRHYPRIRNKLKVFTSWFPLIFTLIIVFVVVIVTLALRLFFQRRFEGFVGGLLGSIIGAVLIIAFNVAYKKLAVFLTNWENHRTQTEFDDALIVKTVLFQFFNTFTSLYYIAFFKNGFPWFGVGESIGMPDFRDACKVVYGPEDDASGNVIGSGCISELALQLATLMAVNLVIGQTKEILIPLAKVWVKRLLVIFRLSKGDDDDRTVATWEKQAKLEDFQGTFDEYAEMAMQYGLVTVFSTAFPLAPLLALLNNWVEVRTDAIKILRTNNKPFYKGAQDIGGWYKILDILGVIGVVTNALLLGFGYAAIPLLVGAGERGTTFNVLVFSVVLEHALIVLKYIIAEVVPDMPAAVTKQLARQEFVKNETLKELAHRPHFEFTVTEEQYANFDYDSTWREGEAIVPDAIDVSYDKQAVIDAFSARSSDSEDDGGKKKRKKKS